MSDIAPIVNTQQLSKRMPSVKSQRSASMADMRLPGEGKIQPNPGPVKEGSAKMYSEIMDSIVGNSNDSMDMDILQEPRL